MAGEFMKSGKISQTVYDRSVFRPLKRTGSLDSGVFYGADSAGCAAVSCGPVCGPFDPSIQMRIAEAVNNLAVDGADPAGCRIQTGITVPSGSCDRDRKMLCRMGTDPRRRTYGVLGRSFETGADGECFCVPAQNVRPGAASCGRERLWNFRRAVYGRPGRICRKRGPCRKFPGQTAGAVPALHD